MEANITTKTVEKVVETVVVETEEVVTLTMTRREAEVIRSVLYLTEFIGSSHHPDPQAQVADDICNIRFKLGSTLGWIDPMFGVDTERKLRRETVFLKLR